MPILHVSEVRKSFEEKLALDGVSFDVNEGEIFGIIGPSACGKSVLLKCIIGLLSIDSGTIEFMGKAVEQLNAVELRELHQQIGLVFQDSALFDSMSVEDNTAYGLREMFGKKLRPDALAERVADALASVGLSGTQTVMPAELSGGMRKRVGIARTVALRPKVILYDEPTAGLDPVNAGRIARLLVRLQKEQHVTSILVSHDLHTVFNVCDRVAYMHAGRFLELGTARAIQDTANAVVQEFILGRVAEQPIAPLSETD